MQIQLSQSLNPSSKMYHQWLA